MLDIVQLPLGAYQTNCYLVAREGASDAVVVDPGDAPDDVLAALAERGWTAAAVLVTHGHFDHLGAVHGVAEAAGIEVWMPRDEADDLRTLAGRAARARPPARRRRDGVGRRHRLRHDGGAGPLAGVDRLPRRRPPVLRRRALLGIGRPHRLRRRRHGHPGREHRPADGRLPARHGGAARPRPGDDARPRARAEPVPGSRCAREPRVPGPPRHAGLVRPAGRAAPLRARRGAGASSRRPATARP